MYQLRLRLPLLCDRRPPPCSPSTGTLIPSPPPSASRQLHLRLPLLSVTELCHTSVHLPPHCKDIAGAAIGSLPTARTLPVLLSAPSPLQGHRRYCHRALSAPSPLQGRRRCCKDIAGAASLPTARTSPVLSQSSVGSTSVSCSLSAPPPYPARYRLPLGVTELLAGTTPSVRLPSQTLLPLVVDSTPLSRSSSTPPPSIAHRRLPLRSEQWTPAIFVCFFPPGSLTPSICIPSQSCRRSPSALPPFLLIVDSPSPAHHRQFLFCFLPPRLPLPLPIHRPSLRSPTRIHEK